MQKCWYALVFTVLCMALTACSLPILAATPTPTLPLATNVPVMLPTDTQAQAAKSLSDMHMVFWNVSVSYDPAVWRLAEKQNIPMLAHQSIPGCELSEQGPTEPPQATKNITLGSVKYSVAELSQDANTHRDWYMATGDSNGPFPGGLPTWIMSGSAQQWETCQSDASEVLTTLHR